VACDIVWIIPHGVAAEVSFSVPRDGIDWRQFKTSGETIRENVTVGEFGRANNGILVGNCTVFETMETDTPWI